MRNTTRPFCYDRGTELDIRNDTESDRCGIKLKRVDAEVTSIEKAVVEDGYEYKEFQVHRCTDAFHGGKECPEDFWFPVLEWFRFEKDKFLNWTEAVEFCATAYPNYPAILFGEVEGHHEEMEWLAGNYEYHRIWLGIQLMQPGERYINLAGIDVTDKIPWLPHQPIRESGANVVSISLRHERARNSGPQYSLPFVCLLLI